MRNITDKELYKELGVIKDRINFIERNIDKHFTKRIDSTDENVEDTQLGLTEAYEYTDGAYNELTDLQLAVAELYETILGGDE